MVQNNSDSVGGIWMGEFCDPDSVPIGPTASGSGHSGQSVSNVLRRDSEFYKGALTRD